jgi:D-citramalate synthase
VNANPVGASARRWIAAQAFQGGPQVSGIGRLGRSTAAADATRVQEVPRCRAGIAFAAPAIREVTGERMAEVRERRADLVEEARHRPNLHERRAVQRLEGAPRDRDRASAGGDAHPGRAAARHQELEIESTRALEPAEHHGAVDLFHRVLAERAAKLLPAGLLRREQQDTRGVDVESVHDATSQARLADPDDLRMPCDDRTESGAPLAFAERMHRETGGLVHRDPARPGREEGERELRLRLGPACLGGGPGRDLDLAAARQDLALVRGAALPALHPYAPCGQHPPGFGARAAERPGDEGVEPHAFRSRLDLEAHDSHGDQCRLLSAPPVNPMAQTHLQVMDTTLRDGEQTPGIAYSPAEKLQLARVLLSEVGVDRIEIAGTRVSAGEREAAWRIARWARRAKLLDRLEILGYCDGKASVDWMVDVGVKSMNLLVKGSERHCVEQLRMSPERHRARVAETVRYGRKRRLRLNVYLEDWSSGVQQSFDYLFAMMKTLTGLPVERIFLADTLGILSPPDVTRCVDLMVRTWPDVHFEYHGHNDYGLATANCLAAVEAGALGIHTSVNGMGERAGNTKLAEIVAALHDHTGFRTRVDESRLVFASKLVEAFSGKNVSDNAPIVGVDVFTQTAGIHADGDAKGDLYASRLAPDRFGQRRRYALGKLSGKASLDQNLRSLGIELPDAAHELVLKRIVELGDKKHTVVPEDLRFIIADVLKTPAHQLVRIEAWDVAVASDAVPEASVTLAFRKRQVTAKAKGEGGYDAFMKALKKAAKSFRIAVPALEDFRVRIPPGGRTGALVETVIVWRGRGDPEPFTTLGVDSDQMAAAVIATEKMLNEIVARRRRR